MKLKPNHLALALTGAFCVYLGGVFTASLLLPDKTFLENENRLPAARPVFSLAAFLRGDYTKDAESYVTDQFPLRDLAMALHAGSERALGKTIIGNVYFGTDGALYQRVDEPSGERLKKNTDAVENFAAAVDVPVVLSLIPTAAEIYREYLPRDAPSANQLGIIDQICPELRQAEYTDCYKEIYDYKNDNIFYRTDHHWTSLGAYHGYHALLQAWGFAPRMLESYGVPETVSIDFYGTLARTAGAPWVTRDEIQRIANPNCTVEILDKNQLGALYAPHMLESTDQYRYFLGGSHALVKITGEKKDGERLLVIRDSYADSLAPFLAGDFAEVHLTDLRYMKLALSDYVKKNAIDRVLVLYSVPNFTTDTNLAFLR